MLIILTSLSWSWIFRSTQFILLVLRRILISLLFIFNISYHGLWIFQDFMRWVLIFLTLYILILIIKTRKLTTLLQFLFILLTLDLIMVFSINNTLIFYVLFEFSLIPMSLMILGWGFQPERLSATLYILFYTISSSFPFLIILIIIGTPRFYDLTVSITKESLIIPLIILIPLLVKLPMFMVHLWLPKAHVEAPVFGSIVLAGILLKLGAFGLWRLYPLFLNNVLILGGFSIIGAAICGLILNIQTDIKAIIAYSRVVHIGIIAFCLLFGTPLSILAALAIIIAHGICRSGLFCLATLVYERVGSRRILIAQGVISILPSLTIFFALLLLINLRSPPSLNLFSEILIFYAAFSWQIIRIVWISLLILFSLIYSLVLFYSYFHGITTPTYSFFTETRKEIFLSFFHAIWWLISPVLLFLFEIY